jgi:hypothetical protein
MDSQGDKIMAPLVAALIKWGLPALATVALQGGKELIEKKTGISLPEIPTGDVPIPVELLTKLQDAEIALQTKLLDLGSSILIGEFEDGRDARKLQSNALLQDDLFSKRFVYYFTIFWSFVSASLLGAIIFYPIPEPNLRAADTILGFLLGTLVSSMFAYYFGTSKSSGNKDSAIARMLERVGK